MKPSTSRKKKGSDKLWAGRFSEATDPLVEVFTASLPYDYRLLPYDLTGSLAHLNMLSRQGIIPLQEAKRIIGSRCILADGRIITDHKFGLGLMDVLSIPKTKENFRILIDRRGRLCLTRIDPDEAKWKLVRIENKKVIPGGKVQLNLHDGRNIIIAQNEYKTGDVLKIEVPSQKVLGVINQSAGTLALLTGGHHVGEIAAISSFEEKKNPMPNLVKFKEGFNTIKPYVFVIGTTVPEIKVPQTEASK